MILTSKTNDKWIITGIDMSGNGDFQPVKYVLVDDDGNIITSQDEILYREGKITLKEYRRRVLGGD